MTAENDEVDGVVDSLQLPLFPELFRSAEPCPFPGCTAPAGHTGGCKPQPSWREASERETQLVRQFLEGIVRPLDNPADPQAVADRDKALTDMAGRVAVQVPDIPHRFYGLRSGKIDEDRETVRDLVDIAALVHHLAAAREDAAWRELVVPKSLQKHAARFDERADAWGARALALRQVPEQLGEAERLEGLARAWRDLAAVTRRAWLAPNER